MNGMPTAAAADKTGVGGDLTMNRLGFGAMRVPADPRLPEHVEQNVAAASIELTAGGDPAINRAVLS